MMDFENPQALQALMGMGVITPMNVANALKMKYQLLDIPNWQELITMPQPKPQMPPPPPPVKMNMLDLTPLEQAQVKQKFGIQPDMHGMMLKHQGDMNAEGIAHEHAVIQEKHRANLAMGQQALQQEHDKNMALLQLAGQGAGQQGGEGEQ
jgi:hypothetical protein